MAVDTDEGPQTPFAKLYYSEDMIRKYQPLVTAIELMTETEGKDDEVRKDYEKHLKIYRNFSWCSNWDGKKYDIVFYGVSGYTGYLMMEYLKRVALKKTKENFTFAFAGRTPSKVQDMRDKEFGGTQWEDTPVMQMSYDDVYSIIDMVRSARVVINVAGPYMLTQGDVMIDACIHMGVHYCDISGEVPWSLRVLDLHEYARDAGVHVIPSAASAGGYPDLGVYLLAKEARSKYNEELRKVICYQSGGGAAQTASGGTLATRAAMAGAGDDVRKKMSDPFSMGGFIPDRDRWGVKHCNIEFGTGKVTPKVRGEDMDANMSRVSEDKKLGIWRGPFVYSYFDTRIVRRSNMLLADLGDRPYGRELNFMEYAMLPPEVVLGMQQGAAAAAAAPAPAAGAESGGGAAASGGGGKAGGVGVDAERAKLEAEGKYYKQGEGPPLEDLDDAWVGYFLYAETESGREIKANFIGRDGYFETARVAVEMALTLNYDFEKLPFKGGVLTPTVSGGECLAKRIIDSGMKFRMGGWYPASEHKPPPY